MSDAELNKAALLIAKLLLRTREGRVQWKHFSEREMFQNFFGTDSTPCRYFKAPLESDLEAIVGEDTEQVGFELLGVSPSGEKQLAVQVLLPHSFGKSEQISPESIVYRDIKELLNLAENPKTVSDDRRYLQALTYLDKIAV